MHEDARVIFRTAGPDSPLPKKLPPSLLAPWDYPRGRGQGLPRPRPLVDLWRVPRLHEAQALLIEPANDARSRRADGSRLPPSAALLRSHAQILSARPRPAGARSAGASRAQSIVEIGCGTARNLIRIAERYPGVKLYGLDASAQMLRTAGDAIARAKLSGRIALKHGLAEDVTPGFFGLEQPFDHAIFSYSLSMIPDWRAALTAAASSVTARRPRPCGGFRRPAGALAGGAAVAARLARPLPRHAARRALGRAGEQGLGRAKGTRSTCCRDAMPSC